MDILVPQPVAAYDLAQPPSLANPGGGVGVKYARVEQALAQHYSVRRVHLLEDVQVSADDVLIVDALWFNWNNQDVREEKLARFLQCNFSRVLLYGSEQNLLRWPANVRYQLLDNVTWVTHNSAYLQAMHRVAGVHHSRFLCDPVPETLFYPEQKYRRIYASGQISWEKSTDKVVEVFALLKDTDIQTCYIGSATTWGDGDCSAADAERKRLEQELRSVTDVFLGNILQSQAARWANSALYHLHAAQHDTSCQNQQEAALGGAVLWGLTHPINTERPVFQFTEPKALVEALLQFDAQDDVLARCREVLAHATERWTYPAFHTQFSDIVGRL